MSFTFDDRYNHYNCDVCNARHYGSKPQSCYKCEENQAKEQRFQQRVIDTIKEKMEFQLEKEDGYLYLTVKLSGDILYHDYVYVD